MGDYSYNQANPSGSEYDFSTGYGAGDPNAQGFGYEGFQQEVQSLVPEGVPMVAAILMETGVIAPDQIGAILAKQQETGDTLVLEGDDDHTRGRYDGTARGLLRELEALGAIRSWGRFDAAPEGGWQHRITVPTGRADAARDVIERWLSLTNIDARLG